MQFEPDQAEIDAADLRVVLAVHSHAPLQDFYASLPNPKYAISLPCCGADGFVAQPPFHRYEDVEVLSPKREFYMWRN